MDKYTLERKLSYPRKGRVTAEDKKNEEISIDKNFDDEMIVRYPPPGSIDNLNLKNNYSYSYIK